MNNLVMRIKGRVQRAARSILNDTHTSEFTSAQLLSDKEFLALFNMKKMMDSLQQGEVKEAKLSLLDYYGNRIKPPWPFPPRTITDLRLNLEETDNKLLIERANSILDYHISPDGGMPKVSSEGNIDWCFNPVSSPEWLWRINRHQWWPVLGLAYRETGDERYADAFVKQMVDWITNNPPPVNKDEQSPTWRLMEVGMRMRVSWIPAFELFYKAHCFNDKAKLIMLRSIYDHARFLYLYKTTRNHLLRESNGLAYVSVYFPEFRESKQWLKVALTRLEEELKKQINQDGSQIEVSTGYQWVVVDEFEQTYNLLRTNNISLPNEDLSSWLEKMYNLLAYIVRPDGTFPEVNDGFIRWQSSRIAEAGEIFGRNDFIYIGTGGARGSLPVDTSVAFNDAGYYVMRSDWTKESCYLFFDAGPYGGYHGHEDKLSIEVHAFGQAFIVDSGSYTYEDSDPFRSYFVGSAGHNTVLVDDMSQIRRWQKKNMNPSTETGNYATWISSIDFDYVSSTYSDDYSIFSLKKPKDANIIKDVIHTRQIMFVKPDYWVLIDKIQASNPHNYQILFHSSPDVEIKSDINNRITLASCVEDSYLHIIPSTPENIEVGCLKGCEKPIQGWFSSEHHYKIPSTTVVYEKKNSISTVIAKLLYPSRTCLSGNEVNIEQIDVSDDEGLGFKVTTPEGKDYLMFSQTEGTKKFASFTSRGLIACIRMSKDDGIIKQFEWKR